MPFCSFHTLLAKSECSGFSHTLDSRSAASILSPSQQPAFLCLSPLQKMIKKRWKRLAHQGKGWRIAFQEPMASSTKLSSARLRSFFLLVHLKQVILIFTSHQIPKIEMVVCCLKTLRGQFISFQGCVQESEHNLELLFHPQMA